MQTQIDLLKPLDAVTAPDVRWQNIGGRDPRTGEFVRHTLADRHAAIDSIYLNGAVPDAIREHFEIAKNLLLYAWFVYRFIPVAELHAYSTVEMALRERAQSESLATKTVRGRKEKPLMLRELLELAVERQWVVDAGFEISRSHKERLAQDREIFTQLGSEIAMTEDELDAQRYCKILQETIPALRNGLAHGSGMIHPGGFSTLRICRDLINQLFPSK